MSTKRRQVVITEAGSGIGRAMTHKFKSNNCFV